MTESSTPSEGLAAEIQPAASTASSSGVRRLSRVEIDGLFDLYTHRVHIHLQDRITILHGPNGVGKTVLLRMIQAFFEGDYLEFGEWPFKEFRLFFVDGALAKLTLSQIPDAPSELRIEVVDASGQSNCINHRLFTKGLRKVRIALSSLPFLRRVADDKWRRLSSPRSLSTLEAWKIYREHLPDEIRAAGMFDDPAWLQDFRHGLNVHLIETQRLVQPGRQESLTHAVDACATDLEGLIREAESAYNQTTQDLDQSFPRRLLQDIEPLSVADIEQQLIEVAAKRSQLRKLGLAAAAEDDQVGIGSRQLSALTNAQRAVLTVYIQDSLKKLASFSWLEQRVQLLLGNLNRKLAPKTLRASRTRGLVVRRHDNQRLKLSALSSGEQHELVLLYDLVFNVKQDDLVMIDEPELSLHLEWQKGFLSDLSDIVSTGQFDVILATHSPYIAGERPELMEALSGTSAS